MSRSGYSDDWGDEFPNQLELYRGNVDRSLAGKRGQAFLREMLATLDTMPEKRLVPHVFEQGGEVCALGAVGRARGLDMPKTDDSDGFVDDFSINHHALGKLFGIAPCMAQEIMFENDHAGGHWFRECDETPEQRFDRMRAWVQSPISPAAQAL